MEWGFVKTILRIAVIISAGIQVIVSAIAIGITSDNADLDRVKDLPRSETVRQLEKLVDNTQSTAAWLLVFSVVVILWETVFSLVPPLSAYLPSLNRLSLVLALVDAGFSIVGVFCFLGSMIASVVLADGWGAPPESCDVNSVHYLGLDCDHTQLEGTNGTAVLLCIVQLGLMVVLAALASWRCLPVLLGSVQQPKTVKKLRKPLIGEGGETEQVVTENHQT